MREDNKATLPWRNAVNGVATDAMNGRVPVVGAHALDAAFYFPRPKSHFGTGRNASVLKASAPRFCATKPDTDKLVRAIGDGVTGVIVRDDNQFVVVRAVKLYGSPRAEIIVSSLTDVAIAETP